MRLLGWLGALALILADLVAAPSVQANHNPPPGIVALPAAPAVLAFRGGNAAFNGTHWGGAQAPMKCARASSGRRWGCSRPTARRWRFRSHSG